MAPRVEPPRRKEEGEEEGPVTINKISALAAGGRSVSTDYAFHSSISKHNGLIGFLIRSWFLTVGGFNRISSIISFNSLPPSHLLPTSFPPPSHPLPRLPISPSPLCRCNYYHHSFGFAFSFSSRLLRGFSNAIVESEWAEPHPATFESISSIAAFDLLSVPARAVPPPSTRRQRPSPTRHRRGPIAATAGATAGATAAPVRPSPSAG